MKDAADRLTPMGVMVLALLREGDMHPYEMLRLWRARHDDRLLTVTNGTLYHTVTRLKSQKLLAEVGVDRDGNRPERTTYALTDAGRDAVTEWVRRELGRTDRPAEFRIALAEAHNLEREEVVDLLTSRRAALLGEQRFYGDGLAKARERSVPDQYLLEVERQAVLLEAESRWMDTLLDRLDDPDFRWGPDTVPSDRYLAQRKAAQQ